MGRPPYYNQRFLFADPAICHFARLTLITELARLVVVLSSIDSFSLDNEDSLRALNVNLFWTIMRRVTSDNLKG